MQLEFYSTQLASLGRVPDSMASQFSLGKEGGEWHGREASASATHFLSINMETNMAICQHLLNLGGLNPSF